MAFRLYSALLAGAVATTVVATTNVAQAASISFSANDGDLSSPAVNVDITATDIAGGIEVLFNINDPVNTGDLRAAYLNFVTDDIEDFVTAVNGAFDPSGPGASFAQNTSNVGNSGNFPGFNFDLGFLLTGPGASGGLVTSKTVQILGAGLDVTELFGQTAGVRVQAVGSDPFLGGTGSAKQVGTAPTTAVPTPALLPGLFGFGMSIVRKRKQQQADGLIAA